MSDRKQISKEEAIKQIKEHESQLLKLNRMAIDLNIKMGQVDSQRVNLLSGLSELKSISASFIIKELHGKLAQSEQKAKQLDLLKKSMADAASASASTTEAKSSVDPSTVDTTSPQIPATSPPPS
jgi:hypothetical protein